MKNNKKIWLLLLGCITAFIFFLRYVIYGYEQFKMSQPQYISLNVLKEQNKIILRGKVHMTAEMWSYFKGVPVIKLYLSSDDKQNIPITITLSNNNSNKAINMKLNIYPNIKEYLIRACITKPDFDFLSYQLGDNQVELMLVCDESKTLNVRGEILLNSLGERMRIFSPICKAVICFLLLIVGLILGVRTRKNMLHN